MARTGEQFRYKGTFATGVALAAAIPIANPGDFASVTGTGTVWVWNGAWADSTSVGAPAGGDTQVQFNDGGDFGGSGNMTFVKGTGTLNVAHYTGNDIVVSDLTTSTSSTVPIISTDVLPPASTPTKVGDIFVDTNLAKVYISTGTGSSADWTILN